LIRVGTTASTADVEALAEAAVQRWGGIDGWVNNAARILVRPFLELTDDDWHDLLEVNLMGYVRDARAAARYMVPARAGAIVNVGSAVEMLPPSEMTAYVAAKDGVSALTRALAVELGPAGVTVNVVAPGATETPLNTDTWTDEVRGIYRQRIPLRRIATPEEIAAAIAVFLSSDASYVTGQVVMVDGGLTLNGSVGHKAV
jgi:NAD(P)-dependent dehydrogenase (short-subunit alcohol dehydrogenase family)